MKLTKYAQSCMLIETKGKRILVDPGVYEYTDVLLKEGWNNIDFILVTHWHQDHCHEPAVQEIMKEGKTKFYTSQEVAKKYPGLNTTVVKEGDVLKEDQLAIIVVKAVHGFAPFLKGGKEINENETDLFKGNTLNFDYDDFISGKRLENNVFVQTADIIIVH